MNKEQKKLKNNKKLRIFILFLLMSLLFWMLIKLSREYTTTSKINMVYVDFPKNKLLQEEPVKVIEVELKSIGFNLLKNKLTKNKIDLKLDNLKRKRGTKNIYYYASNNFKNLIEGKFSKSTVLAIKPDTLYFNLGKSISKKIAVELDIDLQYQPGYNLSNTIKVEPKFITISGPKNQVDSINEIKTEHLNLNNINSNLNTKLNILVNQKFNKLKYSDTKITISGIVEKFTERTLNTNFKVINLPSNYRVNTYPKEVNLVFKIGLSDFNKVNVDDFEVVCDFVESKNNTLSYLIPRIINKPDIVSEVKIIPNKIEFLIEK